MLTVTHLLLWSTDHNLFKFRQYSNREATRVETPDPLLNKLKRTNPTSLTALTTFQDRSTASSDCISKCTVKKTNNGTEEPAQGWSVTSSTIIQVECKPEHSLAFGSDTW